MKILDKFVKFRKLDVRWKLKTISKYINYEIYPSKYPINFFEKLKYKIIFNSILKNKIKTFKNYYFNNLNYQENEQFALTSLPRSGTVWVTNVLHSYFELIYNLGDGNLKYNPMNDDFKSNIPKKIFDLFNGINLYKENSNPNLLKKFKFKIIETVGHYPLSNINMINSNKLNYIILLRNPIDACFSRFLMDNFLNKESIDSDNLKNLKTNSKLNIRINQVIEYFRFWNKINLKKKDNKLLFIFYEDLLKNAEQEILKILNFAKINIDDVSLRKALELNSKNETQKKISINRNSVRITNINYEKNEIKIKELIKNELKKIKEIFLGYEL